MVVWGIEWALLDLISSINKLFVLIEILPQAICVSRSDRGDIEVSNGGGLARY